jgi:tRNA threonylcarbamoyladenosine biosynthesis protein TsaB
MSSPPTNDELSPRVLALAEECGGPLLALDSALSTAAVCVVSAADDVVDETELEATIQPSESLARAVAESLSRAAVIPGTLAGIVVGVGPGSFTGLRVALATAKGLALGAGVPVYATSSLAFCAASAGPGLVAPAIDARLGEVFGALYRVAPDYEVEALLPDAAFVPEGLAAAVASLAPAGAVRFVGSGAQRFATTFSGAGASVVGLPALRPAALLLHAADRLRRRQADDLETLAPRYLRLSEAERGAARGPLRG